MWRSCLCEGVSVCVNVSVPVCVMCMKVCVNVSVFLKNVCDRCAYSIANRRTRFLVTDVFNTMPYYRHKSFNNNAVHHAMHAISRTERKEPDLNLFQLRLLRSCENC